MKPGEVRVFPALELANVGGKNLVVRLLEIIPGKAADLNDPKVKEKMRQGAALRRSKPWQETLIPLWTNAKFDSVDPMDHQYIEMIFFPDRATAQTPRQ